MHMLLQTNTLRSISPDCWTQGLRLLKQRLVLCWPFHPQVD
jgi:hypothetical protein